MLKLYESLLTYTRLISNHLYFLFIIKRLKLYTRSRLIIASIVYEMIDVEIT